MRNNVVLTVPQPTNPDEVLKVTALVYLQEALIKQRFEDCTELIASARKFGARPDEIKDVITGYLKGGPEGRNEAKPKNRLRKSKEGR